VSDKPFEIIVVGQGAAGLAAALSAVEEARARNLSVAVTLIDKASADEAGGNTRWTPAYMRMAAPDRVEPSFVHDMLEATRFQGDEGYFATLAQQNLAPPFYGLRSVQHLTHPGISQHSCDGEGLSSA